MFNTVSSLGRASDRSRKKVKFHGIFGDKFMETSTDFTGISQEFHGNVQG